MWQNSKLYGAKVTFADDREPLVLNYLYDGDEVIGVYLNDKILLYIKNIQGDIVSVVNTENNEIVLNYYYDAWGNISYEASESNVGAVMAILVLAATNFSYRGYFSDYETGLYYLQSRYYDSEVGRFINLDDTVVSRLNITDAFCANLFAYCYNNPVNFSDPLGYAVNWKAIARIAGASILLIGTAALSVATGGVAGTAIAAVAWAGYTGFVAGYIVGSMRGYRRGGWAEAFDTGSQYCVSWTITFMIQELGVQAASKVLKTLASKSIKSIDDLIKNSKYTSKTRTGIKIRQRSGGYKQALKDFNALRNKKNIRILSNSKFKGMICDIGTLKVILRNGSKSGETTIEIQIGKRILTKVRYVKY